MTASTLRVAVRSPRRIALSQRLGRWDIRFSPYLYISPFFILFGIVGLFPLLYTGWVSLHAWDLIGGQGKFVGVDNFAWILQQQKFWLALRNTFSIFLLSAVPQIVIALIIAAVLDQNLRGRTFWRMGVLLPYIVMPVAVALIFGNMYGDKYGLINTLLGHFGIPGVQWHSDPLASQFAIATMVNFRWTGYNALILLAATSDPEKISQLPDRMKALGFGGKEHPDIQAIWTGLLERQKKAAAPTPDFPAYLKALSKP